jgi:hypothetical protein
MVGVNLRDASCQWNPSGTEGGDPSTRRRAAGRMMQVWKLRARFVGFLLPRVLVGGGTTTRYAGYALAAGAVGNDRIAAWCWRRAVAGGVRDPEVQEAVIARCLAARQPRAAAAYALAIWDACGLLPADGVRLVGELLLADAREPALRVYERLLDRCAGDVHGAVPAPVLRSARDASVVRGLLARRGEGARLVDAESAELDLEVARLCFRHSAFAAAARLFERAHHGAEFDPEDRIAHAFSALKSGGVMPDRGRIARVAANGQAMDVAADWRVLLATVLFAEGAASDAAAAIESVLASRYREHPDVPNVIDHCRRIVARLSGCRDLVFQRSTALVATPERDAGSCLRKLFVCGNGWSGSGALYDALAEYDCVATAPDAPVDRYINACTGDETMFVQGFAGLGRIWRRARDDGRLSRMDLWDLFRCHVIGAGGIGHTEHKGANAAANLLGHLGSRYTAVFLDFFEKAAALPHEGDVRGLHAVLLDTTEALAAVVTGARDAQFALFNNAMFGPNIDMVEIFANFKLAVVVRDPLDQYADRKSQDLKHWMSARRFVPFYRYGREAIRRWERRLHAEYPGRVREVEFERFVRDEPYRNQVIDWMLEGGEKRRIRNSFDPERSRANIGIHKRVLAADEIEVIDRELRRWRRS